MKTDCSNSIDSEKIFSLSDSLEEREGVSPEYLQLQEALSRFRRLEVTSDALVPKDFPSLATANEAVLQKRCLITAAKLVPRQEALRGSLKRLLDALSGHAHLPESFLNWAEASGAELEDWFCASVKRDGLRLSEIAKTSQQDSELLLWTGRELAKPFFQRYSRTIPQESLQNWNHGACPCCGGPPKMARLEKETGRRYLWCELCAIEWPFSRIQCPFCGNADAKQLGNLEPEGWKIYRIAVCEPCKGYLRTIDERKLPEGMVADLGKEEIATLHLCFIAEREGYHQSDIAFQNKNQS
ncbi:formate dehydrogenase accessory protein FdhE [bacterium]|nr:formate dehydrogenase accessory protein FdhE [bacterium]